MEPWNLVTLWVTGLLTKASLQLLCGGAREGWSRVGGGVMRVCVAAHKQHLCQGVLYTKQEL